MGYVNSGAFFTQSLYKIFAAEVRRHMIIYVDDMLIMHRDVDDHLDFLDKLFAKFREFNLRLHLKKMCKVINIRLLYRGINPERSARGKGRRTLK